MESFNLAFLDIMSCGLGAIILVFMLVKYNVNHLPVELDKLKNDISELEISKTETDQKLKSIEQQLTQKKIAKNIEKQKLDSAKSTLSKSISDKYKSIKEVEKAKSEILNIKVKKSENEDLVSTTEVNNEENYLLGLKVEGKKIAILIDNSASMTNEKLIDIIKTKNSSKINKQKAKKWVRTKNIAKWLVARLPKNSEAIVVAFNDKATFLGSKKLTNTNSKTDINLILSDLNKIVPENATNLQAGLDAINKYTPTNLYLITDGLPTKGNSNYKSLNPFAKCNSLLGKSSTISGECRIKLFQQTIAESAKANTHVDVILLPIEGDPDSINQFWKWASTSGGLVISPANNWP